MCIHFWHLSIFSADSTNEVKRVWSCGRGNDDQGPLSHQLLSCLLLGLPLILHPVIFLRLLLHRILTSMQHMSKWKSRSSWASYSSDIWRGRSSSTDTDASTLRRRRKVNLTLEFDERDYQDRILTPDSSVNQQENISKEFYSKERKSISLKSDSQEEKNTKREHAKISISKMSSESSQKSHSQLQRQQRQFGFRHHSSDNQGGGSGSKGSGWRLKETLVALSALDVSDTLHQFLPSRLKNSDSKTSLSSSSKASSATPSPSVFQRKNFRFSGLKNHKEDQSLAQQEISSPKRDNGKEYCTSPNLSQSRNLEEYIMEFQRQLVNLPSYDASDLSVRPRSRSVPKVTFEGEECRISKLTPVTRSPSLTPEIGRHSSTEKHSYHEFASYGYCNPASPSNLRQTLSVNAIYFPRHSSPIHSIANKFHATSTPLQASPQKSPSVSKPSSPIFKPKSCSPFLSPTSQYPSPSSAIPSPKFQSPAVSPISPPKQQEDPRRPSSASSSITPTPYKRLDSPVCIIVDIPANHMAVLSCVEVSHF